jgi:hypothetical protein
MDTPERGYAATKAPLSVAERGSCPRSLSLLRNLSQVFKRAHHMYAIADLSREMRLVPCHQHRPARLGQSEEHQVIWIRRLQWPQP